MCSFVLISFGVAGGRILTPDHPGGLQCKAIVSPRLWVSARLRTACTVIPQRRLESSRRVQTRL